MSFCKESIAPRTKVLQRRQTKRSAITSSGEPFDFQTVISQRRESHWKIVTELLPFLGETHARQIQYQPDVWKSIWIGLDKPFTASRHMPPPPGDQAVTTQRYSPASEIWV